MDNQENIITRVSLGTNPKLPDNQSKIEKNKEYVLYGKDNDYPDFLIDLFDQSPTHQGIIEKKAQFIAGKGFEIVTDNPDLKDQAELFLKNENSQGGMSADAVLKNLALDGEIFNAFSIDCVKNAEGKIASFSHLDTETVRIGKHWDNFYISDNWTKRTKDEDVIEIPSFSSSEGKPRFLIYEKHPSKSGKYYPKPNYNSAIRAIDTDKSISDYHQKVAHSKFTVGTILNFANGVPTEDKQKDVEKKIKGKFTNEGDGDELMITFSQDESRKPTVQSLQASNVVDQFNSLNDSIGKKILVGHQATSKVLFGLSESTQLGAKNELKEALEVFNKSYVISRQQAFIDVFEWMLRSNGINVNLKIIPFSFDFTDDSDTEEDELRNFKKFGTDKRLLNFAAQKQVFVENGKDAEVKEMELKNHNFAVIPGSLDDLDFQIIDIINTNPSTTSHDISKGLDVPLKDAENRIDNLIASDLVEGEKNNSLRVTDKGASARDIGGTQRYEIVYTYEVRASLGAKIIPGTRDFCRELIGLNRAYTREEINAISALEGRDVWTTRGGAYSNPRTGRTTASCRHIWVQRLITK